MSQSSPNPPRRLAFLQRDTPLTWVLFVLNSGMFVYLLTQGLALMGATQRSDLVLIVHGARYAPLIDLDNQWWRLLTAGWLHLSIVHLVSNMLVLLIIGSEVERFFGSLAFSVIYTGGLLSSAVISYALSDPTRPAVGASGALMGLVGALAVFDFLAYDALGSISRRQLSSLMILSAATVLMGFVDPGTDQAAHLGGIIGGMMFGALIAPRLLLEPAQIVLRPRPPWRWAACVLLILAWSGAGLRVHRQHLASPTVRQELEQLHSQFNQSQQEAP